MILAKVGPAFQPPVASTDEILAGLVVVTMTIVLFGVALAAVRW